MSIKASAVRIVDLTAGVEFDALSGCRVALHTSTEFDFDQAYPAEPITWSLATAFVFDQVDLDTMALLLGYRDIVDMLVAVEPHIVRGDS